MLDGLLFLVCRFVCLLRASARAFAYASMWSFPNWFASTLQRSQFNWTGVSFFYLNDFVSQLRFIFIVHTIYGLVSERDKQNDNWMRLERAREPRVHVFVLVGWPSRNTRAQAHVVIMFTICKNCLHGLLLLPQARVRLRCCAHIL